MINISWNVVLKTMLLIVISVAIFFAILVVIVIGFANDTEFETVDESTYMSSYESLQRVLDHCEFQRKLTTGEIPERNPDGSYNVINAVGLHHTNGTHYIDNNICEWEIIKNEN